MTDIRRGKGGNGVNRRFIDWIWNIRGSLPLIPGQSSDDAFGRLDPLFQEPGTSHERTADTLTFRKKNQAAQDKMSVFDAGVLQIQKSAPGCVLHYRLKSRALLFCFLAPLLFLGFAQAAVTIGELEKASAPAAEEKKPEKNMELPQHPIDKFLGAPTPEKPKKDKDAEDKDKPSPTAAYVFAGLFAILYVAGRILEDRLVKSLFRKRLLGV
ncbi:hypothetical protein L288_13010 [Sphingobium quisquiliarum P25]|uniref:Uncharacterized protein n=1 Tax=Sphingobium quisquiliarum P25 TaxID=1329909 RepID=T0GND2_9SPHN|nr:hypothetical protein L288_13010 [Sphingobium quisquiliarum P25]